MKNFKKTHTHTRILQCWFGQDRMAKKNTWGWLWFVRWGSITEPNILGLRLCCWWCCILKIWLVSFWFSTLYVFCRLQINLIVWLQALGESLWRSWSK